MVLFAWILGAWMMTPRLEILHSFRGWVTGSWVHVSLAQRLKTQLIPHGEEFLEVSRRTEVVHSQGSVITLLRSCHNTQIKGMQVDILRFMHTLYSNVNLSKLFPLPATVNFNNCLRIFYYSSSHICLAWIPKLLHANIFKFFRVKFEYHKIPLDFKKRIFLS